MPDSLPAAKLSLSFAKLVATPTDLAWSQAYNAGNLFVCLSLTTDEEKEDLSLQALGKDFFNVLQAEFFTLQEKNTEHIKAAIKTSLRSIPQNVSISLTLAFFKDTTLFVFIVGSGKIIMKRGEKVGVLLTKHEAFEETITAASGFLENADTLILETGQFAQGIPQETITQALELVLPNDIVEALSPQIHKQDNGAQAAIVISYRGTLPFSQIASTEPDEEATLASLYTADTISPTEPLTKEEHVKKSFSLQLPKFHHIHFKINLTHRRRLFLNIALVLALLLIISIFFTVKKYNDDKEKAIFQSIYPTAQQYYSEGKGLETVNPSLSQQRYQKAETLLKDGETKLSKGSNEYKKVNELLTQVETALQGNATGQSTNATALQPSSHSLLAIEQSMHGIAFGQDENAVYVITDKAITTVSKNDGTTKDIIKNNNDWSFPVAVVPYGGNIYVLDQKKGLLKFVAGSDGFGKTAYFNGDAPNLNNAVSMAIDSSVWILFKDGTLQEYTKGKSNNLSVTGLTKPLSNPTKIITDITMQSIYILDTGNSRITQFDKNGKYQNAYTSSVIANAKDFDVLEKEKKIFILSGGKVWQLNM